jgi:3D (Asp-Asp-Asp) domain-containing protein
MKKSFIIGIAVVIAILISGTAATAYALEKTLQISFSDRDGTLQITGYFDTLAEALEEDGQDVNKIKNEYVSNIPWDQPLSKNTVVTFTCKCDVTLQINGKEHGKYTTTELTVGAFLQKENISVNKWDQVNPGLNDPIRRGMTITLDKAETKVSKEIKKIDYKVKEVKDPSLEKGKKVTKTKGKKGVEVYQVTALLKNGTPVIIDGEPAVERELVSKVDPVDKVVRVGTKEEPKEVAKKEEEEKKEESKKETKPTKSKPKTEREGCKKMTVIATAYDASEEGGQITATGDTPVAAPARGFTIAVDPSVIPLYSEIYVPDIKGYKFGWGKALDTGNSIKGNRIDLFVSGDSTPFGINNVTITVCPPKN